MTARMIHRYQVEFFRKRALRKPLLVETVHFYDYSARNMLDRARSWATAFLRGVKTRVLIIHVREIEPELKNEVYEGQFKVPRID